jgi:hypothetical protein
MTTYADLDQLKAAFAVHASHLRLAFTGEDHIDVMATNRGDGPIAILRPNEAPDDAPRPPGSPAVWRVHSARTGVSVAEGTAEGIAKWFTRPEAGLITQQ